MWNGKKKAVTFSFDDGVTQDIRLIEILNKYGLKGTHSIYLLTLARYPDGLTAPELCMHCDRDKADVSRMMSIMEKKGLVSKQYMGNSKYRGIFTLTPTGQEAARKVRERASHAVAFAGKDISDHERETFYNAMESILNNLRQLSKDGIPE